MERELRMTGAQGQWIVSTYAIFLAGFLMLTGRCADIYGRFRFFVVGLIVFTLASLLGRPGAQRRYSRRRCAPIQGLGAALVNPAALAIALALFPAGPAALARGRDVGHDRETGVAAGTLFGGILVQYLGWRSVLFVNVPVAALILALALFLHSARSQRCRPSEARRVRRVPLDRDARRFRLHVESVPLTGWVSTTSVAGVAATARAARAFHRCRAARSRADPAGPTLPLSRSCSRVHRSCCFSRCRMQA